MEDEETTKLFGTAYTTAKDPGINTDKLTLDSLMKLAHHTYKVSHKDKKWKPSWFSKIMNYFGWYRQYQVIVIDSNAFKPISLFRPN